MTPTASDTAHSATSAIRLHKPIPNKLVVLTFDDAVSNHATYVAPLLKRLGFGGTFFICEFPPDFATNKTQYMTWEQIVRLDKNGFDVGNHTGSHRAFRNVTTEIMTEEISFIEQRFRENGISTPTTFCYPENAADPAAIPILQKKEYQFARFGEERAYQPLKDHPLRIPCFGAHGDDPKVFYNAIEHARDGNIVVLMFHGVPEHTHPWVGCAPQLFERYMEHLHVNQFKVISMRDLKDYIAV